jgi:hypothetical protein
VAARPAGIDQLKSKRQEASNQDRPHDWVSILAAALFWSVGWSMARTRYRGDKGPRLQVRIATTVRLPAKDRCPDFIVE